MLYCYPPGQSPGEGKPRKFFVSTVIQFPDRRNQASYIEEIIRKSIGDPSCSNVFFSKNLLKGNANCTEVLRVIGGYLEAHERLHLSYYGGRVVFQMQGAICGNASKLVC